MTEQDDERLNTLLLLETSLQERVDDLDRQLFEARMRLKNVHFALEREKKARAKIDSPA